MTNQALAVIFARGTGDEVPLSSARLLAGKPILHYIIQAAQRSAYVRAVYVSTEDERIAAVATAAGAEIIRRPEELAQPTTPLTQAVEHAAETLGDPLRDTGEHLLCLPADAVFCSTSLIDQALETYFQGEYDRLVALLPERKKYVIWGESGDHMLKPVVAPPHLRTKDDRLYSEPGVLTVWKVGPTGVKGVIPPCRLRTGGCHIRLSGGYRGRPSGSHPHAPGATLGVTLRRLQRNGNGPRDAPAQHCRSNAKAGSVPLGYPLLHRWKPPWHGFSRTGCFTWLPWSPISRITHRLKR